MRLKTVRKIGVLLPAIFAGCSQPVPLPPRIPAVEYTGYLKQQLGRGPTDVAAPVGATPGFRDIQSQYGARARFATQEGDVAESANPPGYLEYRSQNPDTRDYNGPLSRGDPGLSASLWRESSAGNDMFRDHRAFQPMDLITIIVSENSKGEKDADTEVKEETSVEASIENLVGLEDTVTDSNPQVDLTSLIKAATQNDFKGEGNTSREGKLTAKISAMVVEVLPSGVLRVEGEKITAVNSEEEVIVLSGLVRTRDINSNNEIESAKVANMRIDYYGKGVVGEAQNGGWLGRFMRGIWPF